MSKLFGVDIKKLIAQNVGPGLLSGTLSKAAHGSRTTGSLSAGRSRTETPYRFRGIVEDFKVELVVAAERASGAGGRQSVSGTRIERGDKRVLLVAGTLPTGIEPEPGDGISIDGLTLRVVAVLERDPAGATFIIQARG